jgi:ParB-like chromosome segregation protein Spo0J
VTDDPDLERHRRREAATEAATDELTVLIVDHLLTASV